MANASFGDRDGNPDLRLRASQLLARYPQISGDELQELRSFYNTAPAIDTALLTCDPALMQQIVRFHSEQKRFLRHQAKLGTLLFICFALLALIAYAIWAGI